MIIPELEVFEGLIKSEAFQIAEPGPLLNPIESFTVERDSELKIVLSTSCSPTAISSEQVIQPGAVQLNSNYVELKYARGLKVNLSGVTPKYRKMSARVQTEYATVHSVEAIFQEPGSAKYTVNWIDNLDIGDYLWPDSVDIQTNKTSLISVGDDGHKLELSQSVPFVESNNRCIRLKVCDFDLYMVSAPGDSGSKRGYLLYVGAPPRDVLKKVRDSLSFVLGRLLVELGHGYFDGQWKLVSFVSVSGYTVEGAAFKMQTLPPAPLSLGDHYFLDRDILSGVINSIFREYDKYEIGYLFWQYWHSVLAPYHLAAASFGACLESLQDVYKRKNKKPYSSSLIEAKKWDSLRQKFEAALQEQGLSDEEYEIFMNKIGDLKKAPHGIISRRFFAALGINLSVGEERAWRQRNRASHGRKIDPGTEIRVIRENKILRLLFNRAFLKIVGGAEKYNDYFSVGFPVKMLSESIIDCEYDSVYGVDSML